MKRQKYSLEFKAQVCKEAIETGNTSLVARRYDLSTNMTHRWVKEYKDGKYGNITTAESIPFDSKEMAKENDHLKRLLGEKDLEIAILRDLIKKQNPPLTEKIEVADRWINKGYSISLVLRIIGLPRSTYYYQKNYRVEEKKVSEGRPAPGYSITEDGKKVSDEQIKEWLLEEIAGENHAFGYYKLTLVLRRKYHLVVNKKKIYRLCQELDILRPQRVKKFRHPRRLARNRVITESNKLWEVDIKYGFIEGENRFFFVLSYLDVFDRSIIDYHMGLSCTGDDAKKALQRALLKRQLFEKDEKPVVRSDNGPQFISHAFEQGCEDFGIDHERIPPRTPNMNAHIESFHRILEDECMGQNQFETYKEAYKAISEYMDYYNKRRIHSSIKYLAPNEFYRLQEAEPVQIKEVRV
ncbi:MAG: IS3 family transposase [Heyndrickxia sp.]